MAMIRPLRIQQILIPLAIVFAIFLANAMTTTWFSLTAHAEEVPTVKIRQVISTLPETTMYVDFMSQPNGGLSLRNIQANQIKVTIGTQEATVQKIQPFNLATEGVGYVVLIDLSQSMPATDFDAFKNGLKSWVTQLDKKHDVSLVTFSNQVNVRHDFLSDRNQLVKQIDSLQQIDEQAYLFDGLIGALEQSNRTDEKIPARRAILVFSDGQRNIEENKNKELFEKELREQSVPIYMFGYYVQTRTMKSPTDQVQELLNTLANYAVLSRGAYWQKKSTELSDVYPFVDSQLNRSYKLNIRCEACNNINQLQPHVVEFNYNGKQDRNTLSALVKNEKTDVTEDTAAPSWFNNLIIWVIAIIVIIGGIVLFVLKRTRTQEKEAETMIEDFDEKDFDEENHKNTFYESPPIPVKLDSPFRPAPQPPVSPLRVESINIRLVVVTNDEEETTFDKVLAPKLTIGRGQTNDVVLNDNQVSSKHCELLYEEQNVRIVDLGSTNGTAVNGVNIYGIRKLESGDILTIGRIKLRILIEERE
jgi:uncharacterized protein YegL